MENTIYNLANEEYHNGDGYKDYLSSTQIKDYLISPKFAKYKHEHPDEFQISTEASEKGSLYHSALESLTNGKTLDEWENGLAVFEPPINPKTGEPFGRTTQKYIQALEALQSENPDKTLTSSADIALVRTMVRELLDNCGQTSDQIRKIIKWGKAEVSHFCEYEGCKFKFRPDIETRRKIVDWKTVAIDDLHEDTINRTIIKFNYDISASFYQFFYHKLFGKWLDFYWCFQQKNPPYDAVFVSAENYGFHEDNDGIVRLGVGATKFMALLEQHIYCTKNNVFDGAQCFIEQGFRGRRIMSPEPPIYEQNKIFRFNN